MSTPVRSGRWSKWAVAGLAVAALAGGGGWWQHKQTQDKAAQDKAKADPQSVALEFMPAEVTRPRLAALPVELSFSGSLAAPRMAVVRAKAAGTLLSLSVDEGARVKAGQTLGRIDLSELATRVAERGATVEAARARVVEAERLHAANEGLARQQFISGAALETSRATLESARAQLKVAQAGERSSEITVANAALTAPIAGVVGKRSALPGERLAPEQEVLTLVDLSQLELAGNVPTHELANLKEGQRLKVDVEGVNGEVEGRVDRIAPMADAGTRSIRVVVRIDNPGERLRAGMFARARLNVADPTERLTLPETALAGTVGQQQVWTIDSGVLKPRMVTVGRRNPQAARVEILSGVTADHVVLAARFDNLKDGRQAKVVDAAAPATAAASGASAKP
jgi:membrane fusion protein, multidrug efflux system